MPPKAAKGAKGQPAATPQFAFTSLAAPPAPIPISPFRRKCRAAILRTTRRDEYIVIAHEGSTGSSGVSATLYARSVPFADDSTTSKSAAAVAVPLAELPPLTFCDAVGRTLPLGDAGVRWISGNGRGFALIGTATAGVLAIGNLTEAALDAGNTSATSARPLAELFDDGLPAEAAGFAFAAGSVGAEHAVLLGVDPQTGAAHVFGFGWSGSGALGPTTPARRAAASAVAAGGSVPPTVQRLRVGLRRIDCLGGEGATAVWAVAHVTLVSCRRGTLALGRLSEFVEWPAPTLLCDAAAGALIGAAVTNDALWMTLSTGKVLRVDAAGDGGVVDEHSIHDALGISPGCEPLKQLSGAATHCIARVASTGAIVGWGSSSFGQLGATGGAASKATIIAIPPGTVALPTTSAEDVGFAAAVAFRTLLYFPDAKQLTVLGE